VILPALMAILDEPWDQAEARRRVERVLAVERQGQPWDAIPWETDPARATQRARESGRPLFVFFFLKKDTGPTTAPC
jgi:hypothetical protein